MFWKKKSAWKRHITKAFECYTHLDLPKFSIRRTNPDSYPLRNLTKWVKTRLTIKWDRDVARCPYTNKPDIYTLFQNSLQYYANNFNKNWYVDVRTLSLVPFSTSWNLWQNHEFSRIEFDKNLYLRVYRSILSGMLPSEEFEWKVGGNSTFKVLQNIWYHLQSSICYWPINNLNREDSSWLSADTLKRKESTSSNCFAPDITTRV